MKITPKVTRKFQVGGQMDAPVEEPATEAPGAASIEEPAPDQREEQDPIMMIAQVFVQGLQNQDCEALAQGAQMFLQMVQQMQGSQEETPAEPVFRKGGILVRRIKK